MIKKYIALSLVFVIMLAMFSGCLSQLSEEEQKPDPGEPSVPKDSDLEEDKKELSIMIDSGFTMAESIRDLVELFEKQQKVSITFYEGSAEDLSYAALAGSGPDLLAVNAGLSTSGDHIYSDFLRHGMQEGYFAELDGLMADAPLTDVSEGLLKAGQYGGKQYLIPMGFCAPILICPKATEDAFGLSLRDGMSWAELLAACAQPLSEGKHLFSGGILFYDFLQVSGVPVANFETGEVFVQEEAFRAAAEAYVMLEQERQEKISAGYSVDTPYIGLKNEEALFWYLPFAAENALMNCENYLQQVMGTEVSAYLGPVFGEGTASVFAQMAVGLSANCTDLETAWALAQEILAFYGAQVASTPERASFSTAFDGYLGYQWTVGNEILTLQDSSLTKNIFGETLRQADSMLQLPDSVAGFIQDEMKPYFKGEKELDVCIETLENKLELYLNE